MSPTFKLNVKTTDSATNGLAWLSFALAVIGGIAATPTWIGSLISAIAGIGPSWVAFVLIVLVLLAVIRDIVRDGIPNRVAIYGAIAWPSLWLAIEGRLGKNLRGGIKAFNEFLDRNFAEWITDTPQGSSAAVLTIIAATTIAFALFYAHKYAEIAAKPKPRAAVAPSSRTGRTTGRGAGTVEKG
jgi:hypothetical protein